MFGDYISVYDIQRAVADGATVPIDYESRLAKLVLDAPSLHTMYVDKPMRGHGLSSGMTAIRLLLR